MSWADFKNLKPQDYIDQQTIYIADKNLRVSTKVTSNNGNFPIIYSGNYGFIEGKELGALINIQYQLSAGLYILTKISTEEGIDNSANIYYFDGNNAWVSIASSSSGGKGTVISVNNIAPDEYGNVTIAANNIQAIFTNGNVPITIQQWLEDLENKSAILTNNHQWYDNSVYDGGTSESYTNFKRGNLQISGYLEGRVDGGEW